MNAQLIITINEQGQCNVQGPIDNKILAYGMLELARDAIGQHHGKKANGIQPAPALLLDALDRAAKG